MTKKKFKVIDGEMIEVPIVTQGESKKSEDEIRRERIKRELREEKTKEELKRPSTSSKDVKRGK